MGRRANGAGTLFRRNGWYYAKINAGGRWMKKALDTRVRAEAVKRLNDLAKGYDLGDEERAAALAVRLRPKNGRRTFDEAWTAYCKAPESAAQSEASRREDSGVWTAFVAWLGAAHPGADCVDDVADEIAAEYFAAMRDRLSPQSVNKHIRILKRIWKINRLERDPWKPIGKLPVRAVQKRALSPVEVDFLIDKAEGELRTLFVLGAYTGARMMDCARARWEMVAGERMMIRTSKTGRLAGIPIHRVLREELERVRAAAGGVKTGPIMPGLAALEKWAVSDRCHDHFVACGFAPAGKIAGYKKAMPTVGFHSLRSTLITRLLAAGVPVAVVMDWVGHVSPEMSMRYFRVDGEMAAKALAALG